MNALRNLSLSTSAIAMMEAAATSLIREHTLQKDLTKRSS